jgi:hypothetical protein
MTSSPHPGKAPPIVAALSPRRRAGPARSEGPRPHPDPGAGGIAAERVARGMIRRHGAEAARTAAGHLNRAIDRGDLTARDYWAWVVHAIHQQQRHARAE